MGQTERHKLTPKCSFQYVLHLITDDTSIVIYDNINQKIRQYFRQNILVQMEKECGEILCILFVFLSRWCYFLSALLL